MARFDASQVDNYKTGGSGSFFGLANDKDYATVRFMYNDIKDVELFSVHEIEVNGQTQWVDCLRTYDEPVDNCPLCAAGNKLNVKMWVPLYIVETGEVKIWERGRTFVSQLDSASRRFNPLCSSTFDIERNGKKGDQNTTYALIAMQKDDTTLADLPEVPNVVGTVVKQLTFEQLSEYVNTGKIAGLQTEAKRNPAADRRPASNVGEQVVTRRSQPRTRTASTTEQPQTDVF